MKNPASQKHLHRQGFALVIVISLMALLLILGVAMLSLSSLTLRTADRENRSEHARRNARFALMIALAELQRTMGPDQRISAPSSMHESAKRKNLTGVWESWKWNGRGAPPDFQSEKKSRFKGWLASTPSKETAIDEKWAEQTIPHERAAKLVGPSSTGDSPVEAFAVRLPGSNGTTGGYAWAAFDQSSKISLPHRVQETDKPSSVLDRMASAPQPGFEAVTTLDWKSIKDHERDRPKLVSLGQTALAGVNDQNRSFHDLAPFCTGLPVNVADGGFSKDLSRLFDRETLPSSQSPLFLYSGTSTPFAPAPFRFEGANPLPSPDSSWSLLHSHYRSYTKINGSSDPIINTSVDARPPAGTLPANDPNLPAFNRQQIFPVVAKAQFVFSISFGYHSTLQTMYSSGAAKKAPESDREKFITWLVIDPVITLWNPYNVSLRFTRARLDLYRVPLAFRLYRNGTLVNNDYTNFANVFLTENFGNRSDKYYRLNILPEKGETELIMRPGEHVVFTAHNHVKHFNHAYSTTGLELRPGFHPPAANASEPEVGGCSTLNICVNPSGGANGKLNGKEARTVSVKANDQIEIEVKPDRAGIDKPKETGGREITGFLKYYGGTAEAPVLIGGVELDYGPEDEKLLLPAYPKEEMPRLVVPSGIPENIAADDYQGTKPPPVVRFKEPFLITSFRQKTERDSREPSAGWLHNGPANLYTSAGIDQTEPRKHHGYEFQWEVMRDWPPGSPTIEISSDRNRGFGASGVYAQTGVTRATFTALSLTPAHSLAQLRHAPLNQNGQQPLTTQIIGNSHPHPLMRADQVSWTSGSRTYLDHCYLANNALFDSWFFSSAADRTTPHDQPSASAKELLTDFFTLNRPLPNPRFLPDAGNEDPSTLGEKIADDENAWRTIGAHLVIDAPFNVNSTRVAAWEALLSSNFGSEAPVTGEDGIQSASGKGTPVLRHITASGGEAQSGSGQDADSNRWNGHRRLSKEEISKLAQAMVRQIQKRGPFLSLAEFVNRQPGTEENSRFGAIEAAIREAGINDGFTDPAHNIPDENAATGLNTASGSPAVISQADLLTPIAPVLTARGDTFVIRAYGESVERSGEKFVAWCEATVSRTAAYVDPSDRPESPPSADVNKKFGRRFEILAFRWLQPSEL